MPLPKVTRPSVPDGAAPKSPVATAIDVAPSLALEPVRSIAEPSPEPAAQDLRPIEEPRTALAPAPPPKEETPSVVSAVSKPAAIVPMATRVPTAPQVAAGAVTWTSYGMVIAPPAGARRSPAELALQDTGPIVAPDFKGYRRRGGQILLAILLITVAGMITATILSYQLNV